MKAQIPLLRSCGHIEIVYFVSSLDPKAHVALMNDHEWVKCAACGAEDLKAFMKDRVIRWQ